MVLLCLFLVAVALFLLGKLLIQTRQISQLKKQIDLLCSRDTEAEITLEKLDHCTEQLTISINRLLEKHRLTGRQIETSNRVFKDTITSLSHDLRTPLATANGYIQLLLEENLSASQREYIEIANERIAAVKLLLDQLFELARIEASELHFHNQSIDANNVLRDVVATCFNEFEKKNLVPLIDIPSPPAMIWADKDALSRIFSNILHNALIHGDGDYRICSAATETECRIVIANRSTSIQEQDLPRLFDRFYTTDHSRTKKTTGLGLAIAHKLTVQMGGKISAHLQNEIFEICISFPLR